jgi:uncharacterized protein YkwD
MLRSVAARAALAAAIVGPAAALLPATGAAQSCPVVAAPEEEASIIAMTNATRASRDAARVRRDDHIGDAARRWSVRIATTGAFVHSELGWARGRRAGENIAAASTARGAYQAMLDSPPHRRNILRGGWRFVGIGVAVRCDGMRYVTMNLMAPPSIRT